jgi:hypothetical protein
VKLYVLFRKIKSFNKISHQLASRGKLNTMEIDEGPSAQTNANTELVVVLNMGPDILYLSPFLYCAIPTNEKMIPNVIVRTTNPIRSCKSAKRMPLPNRRNVVMG